MQLSSFLFFGNLINLFMGLQKHECIVGGMQNVKIRKCSKQRNNGDSTTLYCFFASYEIVDSQKHYHNFLPCCDNS